MTNKTEYFQVTWNDYHCVCPDKYKGRNCSEKDFCQWYSCPGDSVCSALADGHECRTNATFNGVNSTALYSPGELVYFSGGVVGAAIARVAQLPPRIYK